MKRESRACEFDYMCDEYRTHSRLCNTLKPSERYALCPQFRIFFLKWYGRLLPLKKYPK